MKTWTLVSPKNLQLVSEEQVELKENMAKVKITLAGFSTNDLDVFGGRMITPYPLALGHQAVGIIVDIDEESYLKKGDRVLIKPYFCCNNCPNCKSNSNDSCQTMTVAGISHDGFLRDFVTVPVDNLLKLPDKIQDDQAIFIPYIASSLSILDKITWDTGTFIAIGSCDVLGNILAQLAIYYQAIPIILDKRQQYLDKAKEVGIYYNFLSDETAQKKVLQVTSGKMADTVVYMSKNSMSVKDSFPIMKNHGELALACATTIDTYQEDIPIMEILRHETNIIPINISSKNFESSINLIINNAVETQPLVSGYVNFEEIDSFMSENLDNDSQLKLQYLVKYQ